MRLTIDMLDDLALGASFLATGGGGDPDLALLCAKQVLAQHGPVDLIGIDDIPDHACVVAIGGVGAPTVGLELLPSVSENEQAIGAYRELTGQAVDAVVAFEIGGGNSLVPVMAAASCGLPVVDGDAMGRALPEATMTTFAMAGHRPTPAIALDYAGAAVLLDDLGPADYERTVRALAIARGGTVTTVEFGMAAAEMAKCLVCGTVSLSIAIGRLLREHEGDTDALLPKLSAAFALTDYGSIHHLASGIVADVAMTVEGGFDIGTAQVDTPGGGIPVQISIKNEYLAARRGDAVLVSVPDLLILLDEETSRPINADRLRFGQRVAVLAIGCPPHFRSPEALAVVGPRSFGFDFDAQLLKL